MTPGQRRALVFLAVAISVVTGLLWLPATGGGTGDGGPPLLPGLDPEAVVRLQLSRPGWDQPVVVERDVEGWGLLAPGSGPADGARIGALLSSLVDAQASESFVSDELDEFGLAPNERIDLELLTEEGERHQLSIGGPTVGTGTYLLMDDELRAVTGLLGGAIPLEPSDLAAPLDED